MNKKYFIFFICFIIFLIVIFGSVVIFSNTDNNNEKTKDKVQEEISYVEVKILGMLNSLNNIPFSNSILLEQNTIKGQKNSNDSEDSGSSSENSQSEESSSDSSQGSSGSSENTSTNYTKYNVENQNILSSKENKIDWNYLKNTVEVLYSSWPTIMIDLHSINIRNEDILAFSSNLDNLIVNIESEDKRNTANSLAILYSLIPNYIEQSSNDTDKINIAYTKSCIVNAYVLLEDDKWDEMQTQVTKAGEYFGLIINSVNQDRGKISISKTYVLVNEMNNAIKLKDKKLFYLKYKNLMENAMNI